MTEAEARAWMSKAKIEVVWTGPRLKLKWMMQRLNSNDWGQCWSSNSCEADTEARMSNEAKIEAQMIEVDDEACIAEADAEAILEQGLNG